MTDFFDMGKDRAASFPVIEYSGLHPQRDPKVQRSGVRGALKLFGWIAALIATGVILLFLFMWIDGDFDRFQKIKDNPLDAGNFFPSFGLYPTGMTLENAECDPTFTGSASRWFLLKVAPSYIPTLKADVLSHLVDPKIGRFKIEITPLSNCFIGSRVNGLDAPDWWQPEKLPDADAAYFGPTPPTIFFFSRKTGKVYLFMCGH